MSVPWRDPALALVKVGPAFKVSDAVFPSVKVSVNVSPDRVTLPLFCTVMV